MNPLIVLKNKLAPLSMADHRNYITAKRHKQSADESILSMIGACVF